MYTQIAELIQVCTLIIELVRLIHNDVVTAVVYTIGYISILLHVTIVDQVTGSI